MHNNQDKEYNNNKDKDTIYALREEALDHGEVQVKSDQSDGGDLVDNDLFQFFGGDLMYGNWVYINFFGDGYMLDSYWDIKYGLLVQESLVHGNLVNSGNGDIDSY